MRSAVRSRGPGSQRSLGALACTSAASRSASGQAAESKAGGKGFGKSSRGAAGSSRKSGREDRAHGAGKMDLTRWLLDQEQKASDSKTVTSIGSVFFEAALTNNVSASEWLLTRLLQRTQGIDGTQATGSAGDAQAAAGGSTAGHSATAGGSV